MAICQLSDIAFGDNSSELLNRGSVTSAYDVSRPLLNGDESLFSVRLGGFNGRGERLESLLASRKRRPM